MLFRRIIYSIHIAILLAFQELRILADHLSKKGGNLLRIRLAETSKEKFDIYRLRYEIFREEIGKNLPGTNPDKRIIVQVPDARASLLYIEDENRVVGSLRFIILQDFDFREFYNLNISELLKKYRASEISNSSLLCIEKGYRNQSITKLFAPFLFDYALKMGAKVNIVVAPARCKHFYEGFGYQVFKEQDYHKEYDEEICTLFCDFQDTKYLRAKKSPFLRKKISALDVKPSTLPLIDSKNYLL